MHGDLGTLTRRRERDDIGSGLEAVEVVPPCLHHSPAFGQIFSVDVGGRHLIAFGVRHLPLDNVPSEAEFTQSCRRQPAKPVPRHSRLVAHAIERIEHGVVRNVAPALHAVEHESMLAVERAELGEHVERLPR